MCEPAFLHCPASYKNEFLSAPGRRVRLSTTHSATAPAQVLTDDCYTAGHHAKWVINPFAQGLEVFSDCINRTDANKFGQFFHGGRVTVLPDIEQQQVIYFLLSRREVLQRQKANCVFTLVSQWKFCF
jgi:hypothetical protein